MPGFGIAMSGNGRFGVWQTLCYLLEMETLLQRSAAATPL